MKKRILCFGDSNTWGYNGVTRERFDDDIRWTSQLQCKLGTEYTVIDEGLNGRTSVWYDPVEHVMSGIDYFWPCMKSHKPLDLVIIMLGCNDCKPLFSANAWSISIGVQRLVDMAIQSPFGRGGKPPQVLLMAPLHIEKPLLTCKHMLDIYGEGAITLSEQLSDFYRAAADESGCFFADAASYAHTGPDGIHMAECYLEPFAEAMKGEIKKIIG